MKLKDITLKEFSQLKETFIYDSILKNLNANKTFCNKEIEIINLPYSTIKHVQKLFINLKDFKDVCNIFVLLYSINENDFFNAKVKEFYSTKKYVWNTFEMISKNEETLNSSNIDKIKWLASGGDRLDAYSEIIGLNGICERYGLYPFDVANKPYSEIFYLQKMLSDLDKVNYNYNKQD